MFKIEPLPTYERDGSCQLLLDGNRVDALVSIRGGLLDIHVDDDETINTLLRYTLIDLPPVERLWLAYERESCTSGKAGGLICEPLKAVWPATPACVLLEHL